MINIEKYVSAQVSTNFQRANTLTMIGNAMAATMDASETYRVVSNTTTQTKKTSGTANGMSPMSAPAEVATPFPPLKRSQTGNEWPATDIIAAKIAKYSP